MILTRKRHSHKSLPGAVLPWDWQLHCSLELSVPALDTFTTAFILPSQLEALSFANKVTAKIWHSRSSFPHLFKKISTIPFYSVSSHKQSSMKLHLPAKQVLIYKTTSHFLNLKEIQKGSFTPYKKRNFWGALTNRKLMGISIWNAKGDYFEEN